MVSANSMKRRDCSLRGLGADLRGIKRLYASLPKGPHHKSDGFDDTNNHSGPEQSCQSAGQEVPVLPDVGVSQGRRDNEQGKVPKPVAHSAVPLGHTAASVDFPTQCVADYQRVGAGGSPRRIEEPRGGTQGECAYPTSSEHRDHHEHRGSKAP